MSRARRLAAVSGVALLGLAPVLAGCGDDKSADSTTTSTSTTASDSSSGSSSESGSGSAADTEAAKAVEQRGEPKITAVEGPVTQLQITDDVVGTGKEATASSTVTAQYVGAVASTGEVFQSSWQMDGAIAFPLNQVIEGWTKGIPGMKEGGRRTLVIPAEMAYGANPPAGSGIPANADLIFTVDLVSVDS